MDSRDTLTMTWKPKICSQRRFNLTLILRSVPSSCSEQRHRCADRKEGGVGDLNYPLVSDLKREISQKYGVLSEEGVALRGLFIIDKEVRLCQVFRCTLNRHANSRQRARGC